MKNLITCFILMLFAAVGVYAQGLDVSHGTNITNAVDSNGYAAFGDPGGQQIVIDNNEIQRKLNYDPTNPNMQLFINDRGGNTVFATNVNNPDGQVLIGAPVGNGKLHVSVEGSDGVNILGDNTGQTGLRITNGGGQHRIVDNASDHSLIALSANDMVLAAGGPNEYVRIKDDGRIFFHHNAPSSYNAKISCVQDDELNGFFIANEKTSGTVTGVYSEAVSGTSGNRRGVVGFGGGGSSSDEISGVAGFTSSTSSAGVAYGVYGNALGTGGSTTRYGVYGETTINSGQHWAMFANGDFYYTGNITAPSDQRLKRDIENAPSYLNKIMQLQVKTYQYDTETFPHIHLAKTPQIGFIAQELQQVFPEMVQTQRHNFVERDEKGNPTDNIREDLLGVDYMKMIPVLVRALPEQQELIEELQRQIAE